MITLVLTYAHWYPDQPFCPWLLGTEFVEHFFGLARMILPNFAYGEFLKLVWHVMVKQWILLSGNFQEGQEKDSTAGYILDFDLSPLTPADCLLATVQLTDLELNKLVELGYLEAKKICVGILKLPVTSLHCGLSLVALGAVAQYQAKKTASSEDSDSSSDSDDGDDEDESDAESLDSLGHLCEDFSVASAAHHTARY